MLERDLKQPVNVVNRTGGSGVVGHQAIATAAPDGYTFGLITLEITLMHWAGLTDLTFEKFTPLGLVNQDYAAIHVKADSPFKNVKAVRAYRRTNKVVASGTGQGGSWHVALAGLMQADGVRRTRSAGCRHGGRDRADRSCRRRHRLRLLLDRKPRR
jgi:tripartite-type tricarboxylate transporter receptor subunit TctC